MIVCVLYPLHPGAILSLPHPSSVTDRCSWPWLQRNVKISFLSDTCSHSFSNNLIHRMSLSSIMWWEKQVSIFVVEGCKSIASLLSPGWYQDMWNSSLHNKLNLSNWIYFSTWIASLLQTVDVQHRWWWILLQVQCTNI